MGLSGQTDRDSQPDRQGLDGLPGNWVETATGVCAWYADGMRALTGWVPCLGPQLSCAVLSVFSRIGWLAAELGGIGDGGMRMV